MPRLTIRQEFSLLKLTQETFYRKTDAPCQHCGEPFEDERAWRLREQNGRVIRGYGRVCWECRSEYLQRREDERNALRYARGESPR